MRRWQHSRPASVPRQEHGAALAAALSETGSKVANGSRPLLSALPSGQGWGKRRCTDSAPGEAGPVLPQAPER